MDSTKCKGTDNKDMVSGLVKSGVFALLAAQTLEGNVILRPIGGDHGSDIIEAIRDMDRTNPGCKMRLFEHNYDDWRRYFEGIVPRSQLL